MTLNKTHKTRIPVTDPGIVALVEEGCVIHTFLEKVRSTLEAVESAGPDMAIAMWIRLNQHMKGVAEGRTTANRELALVRAKGVRIDPTNFDAVIEALEPTAEALYPLGRFRGFTSIATTFETCRLTQRSPTALMRSFLVQLEMLHAQLLADLSKRVGAEMREHTLRGGAPLPDSQPMIKSADRLGDQSFIVFEG